MLGIRVSGTKTRLIGSKTPLSRLQSRIQSQSRLPPIYVLSCVWEVMGTGGEKWQG